MYLISKKIMKISLKRDKYGIAVLDTPKERLKMIIGFPIVVVAIILSIFSLAWIPYWIFTGRNIMGDLFNML